MKSITPISSDQDQSDRFLVVKLAHDVPQIDLKVSRIDVVLGCKIRDGSFHVLKPSTLEVLEIRMLTRK